MHKISSQHPDDFLFSNARPGNGSIIFQKDTEKERFNKRKEYKEAEKLLKEYGGKFLILEEAKSQGVTRPDILRNNVEYIEIKSPNSAVAIDGRIKDGLRQLSFEKCNIGHDKRKILLLVLGGRIKNMSEQKITEIVNRRLDFSKGYDLDAIVIRRAKDKIIFITKNSPTSRNYKVGM